MYYLFLQMISVLYIDLLQQFPILDCLFIS